MKLPSPAILLLAAAPVCHAQNITFTLVTPQPALIEVYSGSSASGDIDGDGDNDLLMVGLDPGRQTALYLNDGFGAFTEVTTPFPEASSSVTRFVDLDGDADLDLFFSGMGFSVQEFAHIYLNDGQGAFTLLPNPALPQFQGTGVAIGDVDGDDDQDLLLTVKDENNTFLADIFLNDGNGVFSAASSNVFTPVEFAAVTFIDAEGDGDLDAIIAGTQQNGDPSTMLYLNDGAGDFTADGTNTFVPLNASDVDAADTDGDGDMDILMSGTTDPFAVRTILYLNDGTGLFTELVATGLQDTFAGTNVVEDLDNDGDQDLVILGSQNGGLPNIYNIVYENLGGNTFIPTDTVGGEYIAVCAADDFNGDDLVDLVIQGFVNETSVFWNSTLSTDVREREIGAVLIHPNPSNGRFTISWDANMQASALRVFNSQGRLVYERAAGADLSRIVDLDLPAGAYLVQLNTDDAVLTERLVVE
ncbi:MAG: T9SS type A sorting domain-containing protein [Flavobacteriales bacterium]|nr:T9SS type A sorting domain-containing protein [Flavobacteriales bacterium]